MSDFEDIDDDDVRFDCNNEMNNLKLLLKTAKVYF